MAAVPPSPPTDGPRQEAIRLLRQWIDDGLLPAGSPLPGERMLAARMGLPQPTVHRALVDLAAEGLVGPARKRVRLVLGPVQRRQEGCIAILAPMRRAHSVGPGFADHVNAGVHARVAALGLRALPCDPARLDESALRWLVSSRPLGVVYPDPVHVPPQSLDLIGKLVAAGIPCAVADDAPVFAACDRVVSDHAAGAAMLTDWLIRRGRTRIVQVWGTGYGTRWWYPPRRAGYERSLRQAGLAVPPPLEVPPQNREGGSLHDRPNRARFLEHQSRRLVGWLIDALRGPDAADALMVSSDGDAFPVSGAARILGCPPERLDVVGYDAYAAASCFAGLAEAPLASVDKRNPEVGAALVDLLLDRVAGRLPAEPQRRLLAPRLVAP